MSLRRLQYALASFAALALAAWVLLDGQMRLALWILLAGFAVKSWAAYHLQQDRPPAPEPPPAADNDAPSDP